MSTEVVSGIEASAGRANQRRRTRTAIVEACRSLIRSGDEVTMPEVARHALVSEATAYRYFPDLVSLLTEAVAGIWPGATEALAPVAASSDPVARVAFACEALLRHVVSVQGAVRAMIAATVARPQAVSPRPGHRFDLINQALAPMDEALGVSDPERFAQLKFDLAVVISAEALFTLIDLCGLAADDAIASAVQTASTLTNAALAAAA
jgi:AcrR family transcriptional regulator